MRERLIKKNYFFHFFQFIFWISQNRAQLSILFISSLNCSHRAQSNEYTIKICMNLHVYYKIVANWDEWTLKKCFFEIIILKILIIIINQYIIKYYNFIIYIYVLIKCICDIRKKIFIQSQANF